MSRKSNFDEAAIGRMVYMNLRAFFIMLRCVYMEVKTIGSFKVSYISSSYGVVVDYNVVNCR